MIRNRDGTLNVETLVAYADDALSREDRSRIAASLAMDAEAAHTVDALQRTGTLAVHAYDDVLAAPIPDRLIAAATGRSPMSSTDRIATGSSAHNDNWRRIAAAAVVALVMLAAGFAGGRWSVGPEAGPDLQPAGVSADGIEDPAALGALHALLTDGPVAGRAISYDGGAAVLDAPLELVDGDVCWQFTMKPAATAAMRGIACPVPEGGWTVMSRGTLP
jgi:anti-sigma factor RsiW